MSSDPSLVAFCGLYCGECSQYTKGKCPGCRKNEKATWCKIKSCCTDGNLTTCAGCATVSDVMQCGKFNNIMSKIFSFIFGSNRKACIARIAAVGVDQYASEMVAAKCPSLPQR